MDIKKSNWTWLLSEINLFARKIHSRTFSRKYDFVLFDIYVFERLKKGCFIKRGHFIFYLRLSFRDGVVSFLKVLQCVKNIEIIFLGKLISFGNLLFSESHLFIHCHINTVHLEWSIIQKINKNFIGLYLTYYFLSYLIS